MINFIMFCFYFWKMLYRIGMLDNRYFPSRKEIKSEWIAWNRDETRIVPVGTTGRVFRNKYPKDNSPNCSVKTQIIPKITQIRKYTKKTDSWEIIEDNI